MGTCLLLMSASQGADERSDQPTTPIRELCTIITSLRDTRPRPRHGLLLTSTGAPHVGQAPQAIRVAVTVAAEHVIGSRDHGPRSERAGSGAPRGGMTPARLSPRPGPRRPARAPASARAPALAPGPRPRRPRTRRLTPPPILN